MASRLASRLAAAVVAAACSTTLFAGTSSMLSANGDVAVNGAKIEQSTTVFSGDAIRTEARSTAMLLSNGTTIAIGEDSIVHMNDALLVDRGAATLSTQSSMRSQVGDLTIAPQDAHAKYQVVRNGNAVKVLALNGNLQLTEGSMQRMLTQGNMLEMALPQSDATGNQQADGKRKTATDNNAPPNGGLDSGTVIAIASSIATSVLVPIVTTATHNVSPTR